MQNQQPQPTKFASAAKATSKKRYATSVARTAHEVEEAQRLRYRVFFEELGASAARSPMLNADGERDVDAYDQDCDHLLVRDIDSGIVVGCYRIMRPETARRRGAFYSDSEFDLSRLANIRASTAEVGRACIHPDFRSGTVIMLLWSGLARYMVENKIEYVVGCASIPLADGHDNAVQVYQQVAKKYLAPAEYRVFPTIPYPIGDMPLDDNLVALHKPRIPALIKGYTRLGAWIGGAPAWDADFNTADIFILLPLSRMSQAYAKHFFGDAHAA